MDFSIEWFLPILTIEIFLRTSRGENKNFCDISKTKDDYNEQKCRFYECNYDTRKNGDLLNVAFNKPARQSSRHWSNGRNNPAGGAVNGRTGSTYSTSSRNRNCIHTDNFDRNIYWEVDLTRVYTFKDINIYTRSGDGAILSQALSIPMEIVPEVDVKNDVTPGLTAASKAQSVQEIFKQSVEKGRKFSGNSGGSTSSTYEEGTASADSSVDRISQLKRKSKCVEDNGQQQSSRTLDAKKSNLIDRELVRMDREDKLLEAKLAYVAEKRAQLQLESTNAKLLQLKTYYEVKKLEYDLGIEPVGSVENLIALDVSIPKSC